LDAQPEIVAMAMIATDRREGRMVMVGASLIIFRRFGVSN
jgi:hypothetical protein